MIAAGAVSRTKVVALVGTLAVLRQLRSVAALSLFALLAVSLAIEAAALFGLALSVDRTSGYLLQLRMASAALSSVGSGFSGLVAISMCIVLLALVRRNARKRVDALFQRGLQQQHEELFEEYQAGTLEELPPTAIMTALAADYKDALDARDMIEAGVQSGDLKEMEAEEYRTEVAENLERLATQYISADITRRLEVRIDLDQVAEPDPITLIEKMKAVLVSRGLVSSFSGASRALWFASLLLLVPSLLAITTGPANATLTARIESLDQLQVSRSAEAAESSFQASVAQLPATAVIADLDSADLERIARAFEDASFALSGRAVGTSVVSAIARRQILDVAVAQEASGQLSRVATLADAPGVGAPVARALRDFERLDAGTGPRTGIGRRFRTDLAEAISVNPLLRSRLREAGATFLRPANTDDVTRLLMREAIGGVLEGAGSLDNTSSPFAQALTDVLEPDVQRAYRIERNVFLTQMASGGSLEEAQAAVRVLEQRSPIWTTGALQRFDGIVKDRMPGGLDVLEHYQPALHRSVDRVVDERGAIAVARDLATRTRSSGADRIPEVTEALAEYDDWFPGQHGADARTSRGSLLAELDPDTYRSIAPENSITRAEPLLDSPNTAGGAGGGGGGSGGGSNGPSGSSAKSGSVQRPSSGAALLSEEAQLAQRTVSRAGTAAGALERSSVPAARIGSDISLATARAAANLNGSVGRTVSAAARARSFGMLRGFARVGGVVIGRAADSSSRPANFRDLSWRISGQNVTLSFSNAKGETVSMPPYRASLVYRALVYAADGRLATVTMVTASPLADLKILLHPSLVDTPLGCATIELDRFVDIYSGGEDAASRARVTASEFIYETDALYRLAWAERVQQAAIPVDGIQDIAREWLADSATESLAADAIRNKALMVAEHTPIVGMSAFYDQTLVARLLPCARTSTSVGEFRSCVRSAVAGSVKPGSESERRAATPPAQFIIWSGVRERSFRIDDRLEFARGNSARSPLQFMLQVAFTSPAAFEGEATEPWEFRALGPSIENAVRTGVRRDPSSGHARIVSDMEEFTHLQRLFRIALGHQLGRDFPVSRLVELARATRPFGNETARTPRWNPKPDRLEETYIRRTLSGARALQEALREPTGLDPAVMLAATEFGEFASACLKDILRAKSTAGFERVCSLADSSHRLNRAYQAARSRAFRSGEGESQQLLEFIERQLANNQQVRNARQIRRSLRVRDDERVSQPCPAIR